MKMSLFQRFQMYICQCEGLEMGQSNGVLLNKVAFNGDFAVIALLYKDHQCMEVEIVQAIELSQWACSL